MTSQLRWSGFVVTSSLTTNSWDSFTSSIQLKYECVCVLLYLCTYGGAVQAHTMYICTNVCMYIYVHTYICTCVFCYFCGEVHTCACT